MLADLRGNVHWAPIATMAIVACPMDNLVLLTLIAVSLIVTMEFVETQMEIIAGQILTVGAVIAPITNVSPFPIKVLVLLHLNVWLAQIATMDFVVSPMDNLVYPQLIAV